MKNAISINRDKSNRLEILFRESPTDELKDYLKGLGFSNHIGKPKQFFAPYRDAYFHIANDLKKVLEDGEDYFDIEIRPSYSATTQNIELDRFSLLTIEYKNNDTIISSQYVVFDQYRTIAKAIGMQYGRKKYGEKLDDVAALPRKNKTKVRELFKQDKVLGNAKPIGIEHSGVIIEDEQTMQNNSEPIEKVYEEIEIPIPKTAKYAAAIKLLEENDLHYYGISESKEFGDHIGFSSPVSHPDRSYTTRKKAMQAALFEIMTAIEHNISRKDYQFGNEEKKVKLLIKAMEAVNQFARQQGIEPFQNIKSENVQSIVVEQEQSTPLSNDILALPMATAQKDKEEVQEPSKAKPIREQFTDFGFTLDFTGNQAIERNLAVIDVFYRWGKTHNEFEALVAKKYTTILNHIEKKLTRLNKKKSTKNQTKIEQLQKQQHKLKSEINAIEELIIQEHEVFLKELFAAIMDGVEYDMNSEEQFLFEASILPRLIEERKIESYANEPVQSMVAIFTEDYFAAQNQSSNTDPDYVDKVIAMMHGQYMESKRATKKQIETLKEEVGVPNMGMLWEAVELSWLLWYKNLYKEPTPFVFRLEKMIRFWNAVQPTYAYSDSSKELYKQYSTPCPIGAIIAQYTNMKTAGSIFEPSAGNGLLALGADPSKTHVNEIDTDRRYSLEVQGFKTITNFNASEPEHFDTLKKSFDVVVTNPPFDRWEDMAFDKKRIVDAYFGKHRRLDKFMRLEHLMSGLALHTLKDQGKAALIIMGHLYYGKDGYMAKYRPFFNWLYRHYHVDDIINLNSFKLYNKQGAVARTMLILIDGRKKNPKGAAPKKQEQPDLEIIVNDFEELWQRVSRHIKTPIEILYQQLNSAKQYDLL